MKKFRLLLAALATTATLSAYDYTVTFYGALKVFNMKETLTYKMSGKEDIKVKDTHFETRPYKNPLYYGLRLSKWSGPTAWEIEHTHQKLYLHEKQLNGALKYWDMTDGFNFFFVNRAWQLDENWYNTIFRVGTGIIVTHPHIKYQMDDGSVVSFHGNGNDAIPYGDGYDLSGVVTQVGLQKIFDYRERWFFSVEGRITYGTAWAEDEGRGLSVIQNRALHLNYGVGYRF